MGIYRSAGALAPALLLAALSPGAARAQPEAVAAAAFCRPGFTSIKMIALASGHHAVAVTLNGKAGLFLVDTGAGKTIVHTPSMKSFALALPPGAGIAANATGGVRFAPVAVSGFAVGGTPTRLARIYAMDISYLVDAVNAASAQPIQGLIGQDVLRDQKAVIDVDQSLLYLANTDPAAGMTCDVPVSLAAARQPRRPGL
jgi:hypothetical protein